MDEAADRLSFLRGGWVLILNLLLVCQAVGFYALGKKEQTPLLAPLSEFPQDLGEWKATAESRMDAESLRILHPDDYLLRIYSAPGTDLTASLYIAWFRSQRTGHAPHSPQNCLPGNGWLPLQKVHTNIAVGSGSEMISVNQLLIGKGEQKSVVLYWYQTPSRVVASEYTARLQLVADSLMYRRSDTALVRLVVPVADSETAAQAAATELAARVHTTVRRHIPML
jgi:EpsI family protein